MTAIGIRTFHRKPAVRKAMGWGNSTLYQKIKDGLFIPPVKAGPRMSIWPDDEVAIVQDAYIAGQREDDIRALIARLVAARKATA